jgi:hypothetical protein
MEQLTGTLLGNGCIRDSKTNNRFTYKQRSLYKDYLHHTYNAFSPYCKSPPRDYPTYSVFTTKSLPIFTEARKRWYIGKRKIVPGDLQLTPLSLSCWYFDDGNNNPKDKSITISTKFQFYEVDFLKELLFKEFHLVSTIQSQGTLRISSRDYFNFISVVAPYCVPCMNHKIDVSSVLETKPNWGAGKLDMEKAQEIRMLYKTGISQKDIATTFGVSQGIISNVLNQKIYKIVNNGFGISGSSEVKFKW